MAEVPHISFDDNMDTSSTSEIAALIVSNWQRVDFQWASLTS